MNDFIRWRLRSAFWQSFSICVAIYGMTSIFVDAWVACAVYASFVLIVHPSLHKWLVYWEFRRDYRKKEKRVIQAAVDFAKMPAALQSYRAQDLRDMQRNLAELKDFVDSIHPERLKK